jgi:hypothetical protein
MQSIVGLNFRNEFADLFNFSIVENGRTVAFVDYENGAPVRIGFTPALKSRRAAIMRLSQIHYRRAR